MIEWKHELDGVEIEEPLSFADIVFNIQRDELWHGIFVEASTSQLGFYGEAFNILKAAKEAYGIDANIIYTASSRCEGETDYTEVISGKLNYGTYQESCGDECIIRMSIEQASCAMVFKNRFDQKVNIDSNIAFDKLTMLTDYDGLGFTMPLATQRIPISADADVSLNGDPSDFTAVDMFLGQQNLLTRPLYSRVNDNSILTGYLDDPLNIVQDPNDTFLLTPQVLLGENTNCILDEFDYEIRLKGRLRMDVNSTVGTNIVIPFAVVDYWDGTGVHWGPGNLTGQAIELHRDQIAPGILDGITYEFDYTYTGTVTLPVGYGLYAYVKFFQNPGVNLDSINADFHIEWDPETSFFLYNIKECPPTDCEVYLVNETLARATESITNGCLSIDSDYYGRVDSQPYSKDQDGCGGLRIFTPGLKIRQATDKQFFASMKEMMLGLRSVDNIGMGMYSDRVRIEPVEWFYQNFKMLDILLIPKSVSEIEEKLIFSNIKYGYNKWEIKSIKGIDEFCSYKERRTGIQSVNNELDITTDLITSGYIIENLRTSTLVDSGLTDSEYDNDVFMICVQRGGYNYLVEQNIASSAANYFDPTTAYNWRVRPLYNIMRWFKSIAQSYVNLSNTASLLFFTSGKGNYLAEGQITDSCALESRVIAENEDLAITDFLNVSAGTPIYKPETIKFEYPLSIADYKLIKSNPYGYINIQCGTDGPIQKAYIKSIEYKPSEGTAEFNLIKSWL